MQRSSRVLWVGSFLILWVVSPPRGRWGTSRWDWTPSLRGHEGADLRPGQMDERVAFCEEQSILLTAAAGHVAFYNVVAEKPSEAEKELLFVTLQIGMARYPSGFLQDVGLRRVAFTKQARTPTGVLNGRADPGGLVVLDADARSPLNTLHHEFFHLIEYSDKANLGGWGALNPPDFVYQGEEWVNSPVENPCFVTPYATHSAMEDRAEVFAAMMGRRRLFDTCVQRKAGLLAAALVNRFPRLSGALADYLPALSEP